MVFFLSNPKSYVTGNVNSTIDIQRARNYTSKSVTLHLSLKCPKFWQRSAKKKPQIKTQGLSSLDGLMSVRGTVHSPSAAGQWDVLFFMGVVVFVVSTEEAEHYWDGDIISGKQSTGRSKVQFVVSAPCADLKKMDHPKTIPEKVK